MIYIDNESSYSQRIFIPRDEAPTASTTGHTFSLQKKDYEITENGLIRIHPDAGYNGISGGSICVYVTAATGVTPEHLTVDENGIYIPTGDAMYTGVTVNVPTDYYQGYQVGYASGVTATKNAMTDITIRDNGTFSSETGYSAVTVSVDTASTYQDGYESGVTHQKSLLSAETFTLNGNYNRTNGISAITVNVDTASTYQAGYNSGVTHQKSLLSTTAFTNNGSYTLADGWSGVTVSVPLTSFTATTNGTFTAETGGYSAVTVNLPGAVTQVMTMTQAQYDALPVKDNNIIYLIRG